MNQQSLLKLPAKPDQTECCNRGCENCVFVYYQKALNRWKENVDKIKKGAPNQLI